MFYVLLFIHSLVDLLTDITEWFKDIFTEFMTVIILPLIGMWLRNKWAYKRAIKNGDEPPVTITQRMLKVFKKKNKDKQDPNDPINSTALELQSQVQGYIEYLLQAVSGADRVLIHKFHNGGKYHTGVSTQKMKLVYEATRKKGRRIDNELNQPDFVLEKMGSILKKLVDDRYLYLTIKEDRDEYGMTAYFQILEDDDVASNHLSILRSNGQWRNIGVLSIHFFSELKTELSAKEQMIVSKARRDIALLLVGDTKGYPRNHI